MDLVISFLGVYLLATFKNDLHAFKGNASFLLKKGKKKKKLKM